MAHHNSTQMQIGEQARVRPIAQLILTMVDFIPLCVCN